MWVAVSDGWTALSCFSFRVLQMYTWASTVRLPWLTEAFEKKAKPLLITHTCAFPTMMGEQCLQWKGLNRGPAVVFFVYSCSLFQLDSCLQCRHQKEQLQYSDPLSLKMTHINRLDRFLHKTFQCFYLFIWQAAGSCLSPHFFFTFESRYNSQYTSFITIFFFLTSVHLTKKEKKKTHNNCKREKRKHVFNV